MDNFHFDITSNGHLDAALTVAFSQRRTATCWREDEKEGKPRLVLSWLMLDGQHGSRRKMVQEGWTPFLTPVDADAAVVVVKDWLAAQSYGSEPDHDGDNGRGWRLYCDSWGHVDPYHYKAFVAVEPAWAMYGK